MKRVKYFAVFAAILLLAACGSSASEKLTQNSWNWNNSAVLEFFDDGTYSWGGWGSGNYSVTEDRLKLDRQYHGTYMYTFEIDGDKLTLYQDDSSNVFKLTKVK